MCRSLIVRDHEFVRVEQGQHPHDLQAARCDCEPGERAETPSTDKDRATHRGRECDGPKSFFEGSCSFDCIRVRSSRRRGSCERGDMRGVRAATCERVPHTIRQKSRETRDGRSAGLRRPRSGGGAVTPTVPTETEYAVGCRTLNTRERGVLPSSSGTPNTAQQRLCLIC